jgi:hypothetical protein
MRGLDCMLKVHFYVTLRAKATVSGDLDIFFLGEVNQRFLHKVGVVFNLESCRPDASITEQVKYRTNVEVADPNRAGKTDIYEMLHCFPGFSHSGFTGMNVCWRDAIVKPLRGIPNFRVHIFERNG